MRAGNKLDKRWSESNKAQRRLPATSNGLALARAGLDSLVTGIAGRARFSSTSRSKNRFCERLVFFGVHTDVPALFKYHFVLRI